MTTVSPTLRVQISIAKLLLGLVTELPRCTILHSLLVEAAVTALQFENRPMHAVLAREARERPWLDWLQILID